jgi:hypothetical protein
VAKIGNRLLPPAQVETQPRHEIATQPKAVFLLLDPANEKPPAWRTGVDRLGIAPSVADVLKTAFALKLLPGKFPCTADRFGLFACLLDGGLLEMLLELHFAKHAFTLKFLLQSTESLFDVVVADADLHVVVTTFLS